MRKTIAYIIKHNVLISFILGVVGLATGVYFYFFPITQKASLNFYRQANVDVFKINKPVPVNVYFDGRDIIKEGLGLQVVRLRIQNDGTKDILQNDFAKEIPFGLKVQKGKVISVSTINASNSYLKSSVQPTIFDSSFINFQKSIFDVEAFVEVELLILSKQTDSIVYQATGKIAGLSNINISQQGYKEKTTFQQTIYDIFETLLFAVIGIGGGLIIIIGAIYIKDFIVEYFRKRKLLKIFNYPFRELNKVELHVVEIVPKFGIKQFKLNLEKLLNENSSKYYTEELKVQEAAVISEEWYKRNRKGESNLNFESSFLDLIEELELAELIKIDTDNKSISIESNTKEKLQIIYNKIV